MSTAGENQRMFQIINQEYVHIITVNESNIMKNLCECNYNATCVSIQ